MRLVVLGSTGSIGRNTLQVVREMDDPVEVVALAAGRNTEELAAQALEFRPKILSVADETARADLQSRLTDPSYAPEITHGPAGNLAAVTAHDFDCVVSAVVGVAGLAATYEAVTQGMRIALANKETLVAAGDLVMAAARTHGAEILPVDSEHNGLHQCLRAGRRDEVDKVILTASGGPFRQTPAADFDKITPSQALKHPTWKMGARITIDSATLMNKGFEVIEAARLFGFSADDVDVVVHPQSEVHAIVEYKDGSVIAQLAPPDMKLPIRYAMTYPERQQGLVGRRLDWTRVRQLDFEPPDFARFPLLGLAYDALRASGSAGCVLNAADEVAVEAFLDERVPFPAIPAIVEQTLERFAGHSAESVEATLALDQEARATAADLAASLAVGA